jgi:hypothetical protein
MLIHMNKQLSPQPQRPRAFVIRVIPDAQGRLHGQISEPSSADEWRATFDSAAALWRLFADRLACSAEGEITVTSVEQVDNP